MGFEAGYGSYRIFRYFTIGSLEPEALGPAMTGTPSLIVVNELFRYNYWARDRQLKVCESLTVEQFLRPLSSSFPSIRDTLAHLVAAEWFWLECWRGRPAQPMLSPEEKESCC